MKELETSRGVILCCDVREGLAQIEDDSVDAIVTDPPYQLGFMGRGWDKNGITYSVDVWKEALRVLKPGGWLLAFGGCRTYHRLACAVEDAGFEMRDCLLWIFGQGFPKSMDVGHMIDKAAKGHEQGKANPNSPHHGEYKSSEDPSNPTGRGMGAGPGQFMRKAPGYARANVEQGAQGRETYEFPVEPITTPEALAWIGWGTAIKPAYEPVVMARKPPSEPTLAQNVLKWGTGGLNIDGCLLPYQGEADKASATPQGRPTSKRRHVGAEPDAGRGEERVEFQRPAQKGRWPANVMLQCLCDEVLPGPPEIVQERRGEPTQDTRYAEAGVTDFATTPGARRTGGGVIHTNPECPCAMLDAQSGSLKSGEPGTRRKPHETVAMAGRLGLTGQKEVGYGDTGGASRFFYCPKASYKERELGCEDLPPIKSAENLGRKDGSAGLNNPRAGAGRTRRIVRNPHPTVKPIALMRYLVRLVTPPEGLVLDPFCGSGSTLAAAVLEGFEYIGIDLDESYCDVAAHRVRHWEEERCEATTDS